MSKVTVGKFKVGVGYALGLLVAAYGLWATRSSDITNELTTIVALLGGTIGWIIGLFATPTSGTEKKQFTEYAKAIGAAASGFGVAKLQSFGYDWAGLGKQAIEQVQVAHVALFMTFLLLGLLFTYVGRKYLLDETDEITKKRQKLIAEIREKLEEMD